MVFYSPDNTVTLEGRLPKKEDNFAEDRFYSTIENVFVRFDPYKEFIQVTFPCESEIVLKYTYEHLEELAKRDLTLIDLIKNADNVEEVSDKPIYHSVIFSSEKSIFVKYKEKIS